MLLTTVHLLVSCETHFLGDPGKAAMSLHTHLVKNKLVLTVRSCIRVYPGSIKESQMMNMATEVVAVFHELLENASALDPLAAQNQRISISSVIVSKYLKRLWSSRHPMPIEIQDGWLLLVMTAFNPKKEMACFAAPNRASQRISHLLKGSSQTRL